MDQEDATGSQLRGGAREACIPKWNIARRLWACKARGTVETRAILRGRAFAINLTWARVDLERGLAFIWNGTDEDDDDEGPDDEEYLVKSTEREVPLSDGVLALLKDERARSGSDWVSPVPTNRMDTKGGKYWEFPDATWGRVIAKANELALKADPSARKIAGGPHRCRHTFASHFLEAKPDLFALGRVLGHSHVRVTELYSHLLHDHMDPMRNVVRFEAARDDASPEIPPLVRRPARRPNGILSDFL